MLCTECHIQEYFVHCQSVENISNFAYVKNDARKKSSNSYGYIKLLTRTKL